MATEFEDFVDGLTEETAPDVAADFLVIRDVSGSDVNKIKPQNLTGYKMYDAIIEQTGTSNPTATVLRNTLGGTVVWTRSGVGVYAGTLAAAFPAGKVIVTYGYDYNGSAFQVFASRNGDNALALLGTQPDTTPIDIDGGTVTLSVKVYP